MTSIFKKLTCTDCKKYLSVFPIKVYPNRQTKCGRCLGDDGGTVSKLYETIACELKFPCINIYEGCKTLLEPKEMVLHEEICVGTWVKCPVCSNFEGHSFTLVQHFQQEHRENYLESPDFSILLNSDNEENYYLYSSDSEHTLAIIFVRYDDIVNTLYLDITLIYIEFEHDKHFEYKFELYSINKLKFKSSTRECVRYNAGASISSNSNGTVVKDKYFNDMAVCKFSIKKEEKIQFVNELLLSKDLKSVALEHTNAPKKVVKEFIPMPCALKHFTEPEIIIKEVPISCSRKHYSDNYIMRWYYDASGTETLRHQFHNIRLLTTAFSPFFYVANTSWRIGIQKHHSENNTLYLALFLYKGENKLENKQSYKVNAEFTVLSLAGASNEEKSFDEKLFGYRSGEAMNWGWNTFIQWSILLDPNKKFVANRHQDHIEIKFKVTVEKIFEHKFSCRCSGCS